MTTGRDAPARALFAALRQWSAGHPVSVLAVPPDLAWDRLEPEDQELFRTLAAAVYRGWLAGRGAAGEGGQL